MGPQSITVTRALVELKTLDKRIKSATNDLIVTIYKKGPLLPPGYESIEGFTKDARSNMQSVLALIKRRDAIKAGIVKSNATTDVRIGLQTMTVASAIEMKNSNQYRRTLMEHISRQFSSIKLHVDKENLRAEGRLDTILEASYGKEGKQRMDASEFDAISVPFWEKNRSAVVDSVPGGLQKYMQEEREWLDTFEQEVDVCLSESNAVTEFEI